MQAVASVLALAAAVRVLAAIVAGFIAVSLHHDQFDPVSQRTGSILQTFGAAGDAVGALLLFAAAALIAWAGVQDGRLRVVVRGLLALTAILVCLGVAGMFVLAADFDAGGAIEESVVTGFGVGDLVLCAGGWWLVGRTPTETHASDDGEADPLVFAVDRGTGEVFAFFSYAEISRTLSIYSLEDDEFAFFTDEGDVIDVAVADERARFTVTDENRRADLVAALEHFARRHNLDVDAEDDDLTAYAVPISDWQWLELWPGWMRGLGRLVNRLRR